MHSGTEVWDLASSHSSLGGNFFDLFWSIAPRYRRTKNMYLSQELQNCASRKNMGVKVRNVQVGSCYVVKKFI